MVSFGKVLPGESNFAKACEVYGSALAKFILSMLNLPKLVELMTQLWQTGLPFGPAIR